ncbi:hypothetical protein [Nocardioides okcheonensis]|uniref:hypothetical protein n=1 Tax=Nocardioides okcheonensis TaxID=2894081 RepID=UPI001E52CF4B|nr:hypothetical protein [Nocardioides okcheonensis]UFN46661.1 hypothetical protein LN652_10840 [Nocardioides okcheonensis]
MLPRLDIVRRLRPVDLLAGGRPALTRAEGGLAALPCVAPYVAATTAARDGAAVALHLGGHRFAAGLVDGSVSLTVDDGTARARCAAGASTAPTDRRSSG